MKRKLVLLMVTILTLIVLMLSTSTFSASASDIVAADYWGDLTWILYSNGDLIISGNGEINGFSDDSTQAWCEYQKTIKKVEIAEGITSIGDNAFYGCSNLTAIKIPESVTSLGDNVFYGCSSLTSIDIPNSVTSIEGSAFNGCRSLTSIDIPNSVTSIGGSAFSNCSSLTSIDIPNSVTSIGGSAFSNCSSLTSIDIPDSVTSIESSAFWGCSSLTSIDIPDSVTSIGGSAFSNCSSLTSIDIPDSVTSIESSAFWGCSSLTSIDIPDSVTSIESSAFRGCSSLTSIDIPDSVTSIESSAFWGCSSLTSIDIPDSVTSIESSAFRGCSSLTSIDIPDGVTIINECTFMGCNSITSVVIPDSVTSIEDSAFSNCSSLTSIDIPDSVTSIGGSLFNGCSSLEEITLPFVGDSKKSRDDIPQYPLGYIFGENSYVGGVAIEQIFYSYKLNGELAWTKETYYIPSRLKQVTINGGDIHFAAFFDCDNLINITLGNSVTSIGDSAFTGCSSLMNVNIPDSVTSIGDSAFTGCSSLMNVNIPDSVTSIGDSVFAGCSSLMNLNIPEGVTSIGIGMFSNCHSLTSMTIPYSIISIGESAFYGCSGLTSVNIPNSVTNIGVDAFSSCSNLKIIYVDSPAIASSLTSSTACGNLINNAEVILLEESITNPPVFVTVAFSNTEPITYEGVDYVSYSLHVHAWEDCSTSNIPCVETGFNGFECTSCGLLKGNTVSGEHDYENGVCTECKKLNVALRGRNITLGGIIGLNFYFEIDPTVVNADSYVVFTLESGREVRIPVSQGIQDTASIPGTVLYKFSCPVYSTEMSDTIAAKVVMGENESEVYERTVVSYAIALLNGNYADEDKALIKAMLNYGAYAQIEFDHNTDNLANADLDAADKVLSSDITTDKFATALESSNLENIGKYAGATLLLGSETTLKAYFAPAIGVNASDVTFTMNGNELTATTETMGSTTYAVVYIENISADKLDDVFTITATLGENSGTFQCSAFKYCYNVLNAATGTYSEDLINVLKAMYTYNQATIAYLNK